MATLSSVRILAAVTACSTAILTATTRLTLPARSFLGGLLVVGLVGAGTVLPPRSGGEPAALAEADRERDSVTVSEPLGERSWLAFSAQRRDGTAGLYVVEPDGSRLHAIGDGEEATIDRAWSRDGRTVVFCGRIRGSQALPPNGCLESVRVHAGRIVTSRDPAVLDTKPVLSPNWKTAAFVRRRAEVPAHAALLTLDTESGGIAVLVPSSRNVGPDIDWAPDGSGIAYTSMSASGGVAVWLVGGNGEPARRLVDPPLGQHASSPTFSPDGAWIAFILRGDGPARIMKIHPDGSAAAVVAELPGLAPSRLDWGPSVIIAGEPAWSKRRPNVSRPR